MIFDGNRIPKRLWSYAWCGRNYEQSEKGAWKAHGFDNYEASHVLPHKFEMHEAFFHEVFEEEIRFDRACCSFRRGTTCLSTSGWLV